MLRNDVLHCGGAIVSKKHIVTAAHCVVDLQSPDTSMFPKNIFDEEFKIVLGTDSLEKMANDRSKTFKIQNVTVHEEYKYKEGIRGYYDIAVITLSSEINFNEYRIQPICLPKTPYCEQAELNDKVGAILGYADGKKLSITYMQIPSLERCNTELKTSKDVQTKREHSFKEGIKETMICAKNDFNNEATCPGDSGE